MTKQSRRAGLEAHGLVHPRPGAASAQLFSNDGPFFLAADKIQVKYEMLRAHVVDGVGVRPVARSLRRAESVGLQEHLIAASPSRRRMGRRDPGDARV